MAAHRLASGPFREPNAPGETRNRETELTLAFETAVAEETGVNDTFGKIEAEARRAQRNRERGDNWQRKTEA